jgi:molybdate transport system substrate-binding protein
LHRPAIVIAALLALLAAPAALGQVLTVSAASSLTESFQDIGRAFEAEHDGVHVLLNFASSSSLALQIVQGAPADVFASANPAQMQKVVEEGLTAGEPTTFTGNRLVIIVPDGSSMASPEGLAAPGTKVVLAAPEVPVGNYARQSLRKMNALYGTDFAERVTANVVSEEPNVRQVAAKVQLGEADAAIVYATDAIVTDNTRVIEIPDPVNIVASYPIAVVDGSTQQQLARSFVDFVLSTEGQALLAAHGFRPAQ